MKGLVHSARFHLTYFRGDCYSTLAHLNVKSSSQARGPLRKMFMQSVIIIFLDELKLIYATDVGFRVWPYG